MKRKQCKPLIQKICLVLVIFTFIGLCACTEQKSESIDSFAISEKYYVLNTNSKKIHQSDCGTGGLIHEKNRKIYYGTIDSLIQKGYTTCGNCFP